MALSCEVALLPSYSDYTMEYGTPPLHSTTQQETREKLAFSQEIDFPVKVTVSKTLGMHLPLSPHALWAFLAARLPVSSVDHIVGSRWKWPLRPASENVKRKDEGREACAPRRLGARGGLG